MSHPSPIPEFPTTPQPPHPSHATEDPALYRAGGYHPVPQLPYDLAPSYRIIHKLSFNESSTSWLAVRRPGAGNAISSTASTSTIASNFGSESSSSTATRSSSSSASWAGAELVEIKILTAAASKVSPEAEVLRKLTHRGLKEKLLGKMMMKNSNNNNNNKKASALVQDFIDDFYVMGPNGRHRCIVTEALGPSVEDVQRMVGGLLPPKVGRDAVVAVVRGVEGIHAKGVIHGDISPSNLRFVIPTLSCWTEHDILGRIGKPEPIAVPPNFVYGANNDRNTPSYLVPPAQLSRLWPHCIDDNDGTSLRICGFDKSIFTPNSKTARSLYKRMVKAQKKAGGEAGIPPGSSRSSKATPPERDPQLDKELGIISVPPPPELLLLSSEHERELGSGANPLIALGRADAPAADVFSLGCTLYSILSAEPLFPQAHILPRPTQPMTPPESPAMSRTSPTPLDLLLITMVRTLGRPPETNYRQWPGRTRYFTDAQDGSTEEADGVARATSLDGRLDELVTTDGQDRRVGLGPGEVAEFGRMLKMMVNWFPQERCTVTQAVRMLPRSWVLDGQ